MSDAWRSRRIRRDANVPGRTPYDRSEIDIERLAFLAAIREHDRRASRHVR